MTANEVTRLVDDAGLRLVRFLWCGDDGTIRAKAAARHGLEHRLERGIGLGEHRLMPALETFRALPYAPRTGALLTDHAGPDGEPAPTCQRSFLKRMELRLAERGLVLRAGFANEFSLARRVDDGYRPLAGGAWHSTLAMSAAQKYVDALVAALDRQRIPLEQYATGRGPGQQEIATAHAPALRAADEQILVRETIRGVAAGEDLVASLAPQPWPHAAGNGVRVHVSLWERDRNRFYDAGPSELARAFAAGVRAHLPGLCALTAPGTGLSDAAPLSLAGTDEPSTRVVLTAADASASPYLALGGIVAAGLDGLDADSAGAPPSSSPAEALAALAADAVLTDALGPELTAAYLAARRGEPAEDEPFERY